MTETTIPRRKCLLVDDSMLNLQFLEYYLKPFGVHVSSAENAKQGYQLLLADSYDFSFIDQNMPQESGTDLILRCARENMLNNCGKIYICTAHENFDLELHGIDQLVSGILPKPLDMANVEEILG